MKVLKENELIKALQEMPEMKLIELFKEFGGYDGVGFWEGDVYENFGAWLKDLELPDEEMERITEEFKENYDDYESPVRYNLVSYTLEVVDYDEVYEDCYVNIDQMVEFLESGYKTHFWTEKYIKDVINKYGLVGYFE